MVDRDPSGRWFTKHSTSPLANKKQETPNEILAHINESDAEESGERRQIDRQRERGGLGNEAPDRVHHTGCHATGVATVRCDDDAPGSEPPENS